MGAFLRSGKSAATEVGPVSWVAEGPLSESKALIETLMETLMRLLLSCLILVQTMVFCHEKRPCLRALIVYDTSTTDVTIASAADVSRMKQAFAYIAQQAGLRFQPTVINAAELSKRTMQIWLKTIKASSKEGAFFYYSGNGFSANKTRSKWPLITFGKERRISASMVAKHIKMHKPKLGIVVFDCYSQSFTAQDGVDVKFIYHEDISKLGNMHGIKNMFCHNKGIIMAASCSDVRKAFCSTKMQPIGGLFTSKFLDGLFAYSRHPNANWCNVRVYTRFTSSNAHMDSEPFFKMNIRSENGHYVKG